MNAKYMNDITSITFATKAVNVLLNGLPHFREITINHVKVLLYQGQAMPNIK